MITGIIIGIVAATLSFIVFYAVIAKQRDEYAKALSCKEEQIKRLTASRCYQTGYRRATDASADAVVDYMSKCQTLEIRVKGLARENAKLRALLADSGKVIEA